MHTVRDIDSTMPGLVESVQMWLLRRGPKISKSNNNLLFDKTYASSSIPSIFLESYCRYILIVTILVVTLTYRQSLHASEDHKRSAADIQTFVEENRLVKRNMPVQDSDMSNTTIGIYLSHHDCILRSLHTVSLK